MLRPHTAWVILYWYSASTAAAARAGLLPRRENLDRCDRFSTSEKNEGEKFPQLFHESLLVLGKTFQ